MLRNKYLLVVLLCMIPFLGWGQQKVQALEFEIGGGYSIAAKSGKTLGAGQLFLEIRNNLPGSKIDFGIQFCLGGTIKDNVYAGGYAVKWQETGTYLLPIIDYNFRHGKKISYFVGSGFGMMISKVNLSSYGSTCVMPRAGIEVYNRFRLTLDYKWNWKGEYNYGGISVGFVFGGETPLPPK